jgi:hypothetical protein
MNISDYNNIDFEILISRHCIKHILKIDPSKRIEIYECMKDLVTDRKLWKNRNVKKLTGFSNSRVLRTARINSGDRLLFEGPLKCPNSNRILFIHDFCDHDGLNAISLNIFQNFEDYPRIILLKNDTQFQAYRKQVLYREALAEAYYQWIDNPNRNHDLIEAKDIYFNLYKESRKKNKLSKARHYSLRLGNCCFELTQYKNAMKYYLEGKHFIKIYENAVLFNMNIQEVKTIQYKEAEYCLQKKPPDYERALKLYTILKDNDGILSIEARKFENKRMYYEAAYAYIKANSKRKAKECIQKTKNRRVIQEFNAKFGF